MGSRTVGVVLAVALVTLGIWVFRADIATRIMARGAQTAMSADRIGDLPDGLHVVFCGAGSPMPDPRRSGPCIAVIAGTTLVIVDAGTNGARNLLRMGVRPGRIEALFLTHFHSDHIDGLGELAMQRWIGAARTEPLPVYGPPGVEQVVEGFNLAYTADFGYRTAHHGADIAPPSGAGSLAALFPAPRPGDPIQVWSDQGLTVTAFQVGHEPVDPAVGYRFEYGGRTLVISGDTRAVAEVVAVANGADLLLHEALAPDLVTLLSEVAAAAGQPGIAKITRDILDYHASPIEAAQIAAEAGVDSLVLYHIVPPLLVPGAEAAFVRGVRQVYDGKVTVARDGTVVSLPAGTREVRYSQLL